MINHLLYFLIIKVNLKKARLTADDSKSSLDQKATPQCGFRRIQPLTERPALPLTLIPSSPSL